MAERESINNGFRLDIQQLQQEAQRRWLRPAEISEILRNYQTFQISSEPPNQPPGGSLFLFDRRVLRYFRKDGHNWRKKKDGKTINEAHEKLKVGSVDVLHVYYAHGEDNDIFQRRIYWMLDEEYTHIVFVHYLEVKGNRRGIKESEPVISNSLISNSLSNSISSNYNEAIGGNTGSPSASSSYTSSHEDVESDQLRSMDHLKKPDALRELAMSLIPDVLEEAPSVSCVLEVVDKRKETSDPSTTSSMTLKPIHTLHHEISGKRVVEGEDMKVVDEEINLQPLKKRRHLICGENSERWANQETPLPNSPRDVSFTTKATIPITSSYQETTFTLVATTATKDPSPPKFHRAPESLPKTKVYVRSHPKTSIATKNPYFDGISLGPKKIASGERPLIKSSGTYQVPQKSIARTSQPNQGQIEPFAFRDGEASGVKLGKVVVNNAFEDLLMPNLGFKDQRLPGETTWMSEKINKFLLTDSGGLDIELREKYYSLPSEDQIRMKHFGMPQREVDVSLPSHEAVKSLLNMNLGFHHHVAGMVKEFQDIKATMAVWNTRAFALTNLCNKMNGKVNDRDELIKELKSELVAAKEETRLVKDEAKSAKASLKAMGQVKGELKAARDQLTAQLTKNDKLEESFQAANKERNKAVVEHHDALRAANKVEKEMRKMHESIENMLARVQEERQRHKELTTRNYELKKERYSLAREITQVRDAYPSICMEAVEKYKASPTFGQTLQHKAGWTYIRGWYECALTIESRFPGVKVGELNDPANAFKGPHSHFSQKPLPAHTNSPPPPINLDVFGSAPCYQWSKEALADILVEGEPSKSSSSQSSVTQIGEKGETLHLLQL